MAFLIKQTVLKLLAETMPHVAYPGYRFTVGEKDDVVYIYAYDEESQFTRRWFINWDSKVEDIVQAALLCVLEDAERRVRQRFTYNGNAVGLVHLSEPDCSP